MTIEHVPLETLIEVRQRLIADVRARTSTPLLDIGRPRAILHWKSERPAAWWTFPDVPGKITGARRGL